MIVAGVDTHKATHALCVLDANGAIIFEGEFKADRGGYKAIASSIGSAEECMGIGIEGTSTYGAGLARYLMEGGYRVYEVLSPKKAPRRPGSDKNDLIDARRAAVNVLIGENLTDPKPGVEWIEQVRVLQTTREQAVKTQTAMVNAARSLLVCAPEEFKERFNQKTPKALMEAILRARKAEGLLQGSTLSSLKGLARIWKEAFDQSKHMREQMKSLISEHAAPLMEMKGSSELAAAKIVVSVGDCGERIGTEAKFAAHCGVSPVEASSGKTVRHRLNRGGDRQANRALFSIALVRMRYDEQTKAYVAKRTAEGLSKKEIIRCLKRYIAREVFHCLKQCL